MRTLRLDEIGNQELKEIYRGLAERFGESILRSELIAGNKLHLHVERDSLRKISSHIFNELGAFYCTTAGVDERPLGGGFKAYHIFSIDEKNLFILVSAEASPSFPRLPSIANDVQGANWAEREVRDLLGIEFDGHPDPRRLVLPDDWPDGVHPLRKDFRYDLKEVPRVEKEYPMRKPEAQEYVMPIGPYHPALHEPEYFRLYVRGGRVVDAEYRGFGVFRGVEKVAEGRLTYNQIPFIAERICGICGFTHSSCYCEAIEEASGIEVPERAQYIRTIMLELERIESHLLWVGVALHLLGFDTGFMHCWRIREGVMDLCELISGNRKTYGMNIVGGVRRDITEKGKEKALEYLAEMRKELREISETVLGMSELTARIKNVGILSKADARKLSVVGPTARGSGLKRDVRVDHPYFAYGNLSFKIPVYSEGDVWARLMVRVEELFSSADIIEQALEEIPGGELMAQNVEIPVGAKGLGATEAPRGEDIHFLITGAENRIYRWKVRAPTYNNLPSVPIMLRDENLADAPIIIASIDPCFSCTDRMMIVDEKTGEERVLGAKEILRLSRRREMG